MYGSVRAGRPYPLSVGWSNFTRPAQGIALFPGWNRGWKNEPVRFAYKLENSVQIYYLTQSYAYWQAFQDQPSAYLLRVPPLNPSSLVKANVGQAMRIVLLTDNRLASSAIEPELIDSGVILAQRFIRQRFPAVASKSVTSHSWII